MLSPRAIRLFLKYFDSVDQALSKRLIRKRTWDEEALTFLLTELLDEEAQSDHILSYSHDRLLKDLTASDEPMSINVHLETHSYPKSVERHVTQSDIGFILSYEDQFDHDASFRRAWLFQAKRLFPTTRRQKHGFTADSRFESIDASQQERMRRLRDWAGCDFIRFLYYCPRPSALEKGVREQLCAARSRALARNIFDFSLGLELRDDFLSDNPTVAAGIFVGLLDHIPASLFALHAAIFTGVSPFSWFIVSQLTQTNGIFGHHDLGEPGRANDRNLNNPAVEALVRGDAAALSVGRTPLGLIDVPERILPAHTITVKVVNGIDRPRNRQEG